MLSARNENLKHVSHMSWPRDMPQLGCVLAATAVLAILGRGQLRRFLADIHSAFFQ
jgi:hypothetical protein